MLYWNDEESKAAHLGWVDRESSIKYPFVYKTQSLALLMMKIQKWTDNEL